MCVHHLLLNVRPNYLRVTYWLTVDRVVVVAVVQMYDVSSGKSFPAGYVSLNSQDTFTVSLTIPPCLSPAEISRQNVIPATFASAECVVYPLQQQENGRLLWFRHICSQTADVDPGLVRPLMRPLIARLSRFVQRQWRSLGGGHWSMPPPPSWLEIVLRGSTNFVTICGLIALFSQI